MTPAISYRKNVPCADWFTSLIDLLGHAQSELKLIKHWKSPLLDYLSFLVFEKTVDLIYLFVFGIHTFLLTLLAFKHETRFIVSGFNLISVVTSQVTDTELLSLPFRFNLAPVCYAKPQEGLFDIGVCLCVCMCVSLILSLICTH